jgi:hypothetical protein
MWYPNMISQMLEEVVAIDFNVSIEEDITTSITDVNIEVELMDVSGKISII